MSLVMNFDQKETLMLIIKELNTIKDFKDVYNQDLMDLTHKKIFLLQELGLDLGYVFHDFFGTYRSQELTEEIRYAFFESSFEDFDSTLTENVKNLISKVNELTSKQEDKQ